VSAMSEVKFRRVRAGHYEYRGRHIIRTTWADEGPRGGTRYVWELGRLEDGSGVVLDGLGTFRTRADAAAEVDAEIGAGDLSDAGGRVEP